mmetsp:Transcript_88924/g.269672  ORF Transcript_88924/g.269672 Transcript_88924/m.269672 type:complete len:388 (-) Transcript_88924:40-1203(-)
MGSASEEEFTHLLKHLEALSLQRAAKLAGAGPAATGACGGSCSAAFLAALCEACGDPVGDVAGLYARLPRDGNGRADLLGVFGMAPAPESRPTAPDAAGMAGGEVFPADYVERAMELPRACTEDFLAAAQQLAEAEAAEASWATDIVALNKVRSALVKGIAGADGAPGPAPAVLTAPLLTAVARRCGSRRPALAKCALRALVELAQGGDGSGAVATAADVWPEAAEAAIASCMGAMRGTKVVARLAEAALSAVAGRVAAEASTAAAARVLAACTSAEVGITAPQPAVVSLGLRALAPLVPGLGTETSHASAEQGSLAADEIASLCEAVLSSRRLAPVFSEARATLRALQAEERPRKPEAGSRGGAADGRTASSSSEPRPAGGESPVG